MTNEALLRCLTGALKTYWSGRTSMSSMLADPVRIEPEKMPLGTDAFEIDQRVARTQKDAVLKSTGKVRRSKARFQVAHHTTILSMETVTQLEEVVQGAGRRFELLDN
jgi:hypothetical protein